jgi:ABC-type transport system substrate-binding protein
MGSTHQYLDPSRSYFSYDYNIGQNVYETLVYFNGTSSSVTIPWLASNYTQSADGKTVKFTLRSGITFQDGEQLNSTAVYFSFNRILIDDSSTPNNHGTQGAWIIQQLANKSLSTFFGGSQSYSQSWAQQVLNENFIQITGPMTFTMNLQNPNAALNQILADNLLSAIIAPDFVMSHDLPLWKSAGYTLPFGAPSGNSTAMINQYLMDLASTCNAGATPKGCAKFYLDDSAQGSLAGTGPYSITSVNLQSNNIVLTANPSYWGGANPTKITPQIKTINLNYVPDPKTAEIDLQNAAKSGQAMAIFLPGDHLYDVANRTAWLSNNVLQSTIPGVSMYGPVSGLSTLFDPFYTNVTNPLTGSYYTFQPFADVRFRLAFADSVNMSQINIDVNNKLGQVATNVVAPGLAPTGSFNSTLQPRYSFNPDTSAQMLLSAMSSPMTKFNFFNGTAAPSGYFNNSFGCNPLPTSGSCAHPMSSPAINLYVGAGDTIDTQIFTQIAQTINNISSTYNMGLQVSVVPVPTGALVTQAFSSASTYYMYALGWFADYNWVVDFTSQMYAPSGAYDVPGHWNLTAEQDLLVQQEAATAANNITGVVKTTQLMNEVANNAVMYLWTIYPLNILVMTSNVLGFQYNPAGSTDAGGDALEYFYYLY